MFIQTLPPIRLTRADGAEWFVTDALYLFLWPQFTDGTVGITVQMPDGVHFTFPRCTVEKELEHFRGAACIRIHEVDWVMACE